MFRLFGRLSVLCLCVAALALSVVTTASAETYPTHSTDITVEKTLLDANLETTTLSNLRTDDFSSIGENVSGLSTVFGAVYDVAFFELKKPKFKKLKFGNRIKTKGKKLEAVVDLSSQRISVYVDGVRIHKWWVSSGRWGYETPPGTYKPERMYRKYYSKKYNGSPMPNSVFFHGGYAIHGSYALLTMGRKASHGCIRLTPPRARQFYNLVKAHGKSNTTIRIVR